MSEELVVNLGILFYLLGIVANVLYPYLTALLNDGAEFDYKYAVSRVLAALLVGGAAIAAPGFIESLIDIAGAYDYVALYALSVFFLTFGISSAGRETQKLGSAVVKKLNGS
jgi:O-antigen/teichoic acid export membrane protein